MAQGSDSAIVFGGGGVWGIAWMTGVAAGLAERGVDLRSADLFVGTSAGSVVASQLRGGLGIEDCFERQAVTEKQPRELTPPPNCLAILMDVMSRDWNSPEQRLRAICELARATETVDVAERRASVSERLSPLADEWPERRLLLTAVDMQTLELTVFDAGSEVSLTDAVAASCAVPGVWPPVPIGGRLYVDGGVWRTAENAQLAASCRSVLILSPVGADETGALGPALEADIAGLEAGGAKVHLVCADADSLAAMWPGPMDPATRAPAAHAGRAQGRAIAREVGAFLAAG